MAQIIGLPKLSPTMEEGILVRWVKKKGDAVFFFFKQKTAYDI